MDDTTSHTAAGAPRRAVLALGAAGVTGTLAGCSVYGGETNEPPPPPPPDDDPDGTGDDPDATDGGDGEGDGNGDGDGEPAGTPVTTTGEVPVGGGVIEDDQGVVVVQPSEGDFRGFSSVCTHQGCTVSSVEDGTINCACHGSRFSIEDGSVVQAAQGVDAAAQDPLPEVGIVVEGDTVALPS